MRQHIILLTLLITANISYAQVGIGTSSPAGSSQLDVTSTTKGLLPPRMTTSQRDAISSPATGLQIYNTDNRAIETYTGTTGEWLTLGRGKSGVQTNTALGVRALYTNTTGSYNTASGYKSLYYNTSGGYNTANGYGALFNNTTGNNNTANGYQSLISNTTGSYHTASGFRALYYNTTGGANTANGYLALYSNTTGSNITATGYESLYSNTTGINNQAYGFRSLRANNTGYHNNAFGVSSLYYNTGGYQNEAFGNGALYSITTGYGNIGIGHAAGDNNNSNKSISIGYNAGGLGCGHDAVYLGTEAHYSSNVYNNSAVIGWRGYVSGSSQFRVSSYISSIGGWQNWTNVSDARVKKNVSISNVPGLNFVLNLTPVTYQLDEEAHKRWHIENHFGGKKPENYDDSPYQIDDEIQVGFIAQDVEKTAEDLGYQFSGVDKPDNDKDLYGIRYSSFVVPLVKAVQEQQALIEKLLERIEALEKD
jgi:hypothetical protein